MNAQTARRSRTVSAGMHDPKWTALWAAMLGYMLDAMDVLLYVFALQTLRSEFQLDNASAGLVSSATLVASAIGGIFAGLLSDRIGRKRVLIYTILIYSLASAGTATSTGLASLVFWRALVGVGLGGEWSAGATLVAESWPPHHRGRAIAFMQAGWALGYMLAAVVTRIVLPAYGWRVLFLVGVAPALLTMSIRKRVVDPEIWTAQKHHGTFADLFRGALLRTTVLATLLTSAVLCGYWGLFTWLPGFLSAPKSAGGAGMTIFQTTDWVFLLNIGTFLGYITFGWLADRLGRRVAFVFYMLSAAILVPSYGSAPQWAGASSATVLLYMGPLIGFFGTGFFALFGAMLAELYPTSVRGAGQGFTYNFGRAIGALAPYLVGMVADQRGIGTALGVNAAFFLVGAVLIFTLPETRNRDLAA
jgi:MFS family permease